MGKQNWEWIFLQWKMFVIESITMNQKACKNKIINTGKQVVVKSNYLTERKLTSNLQWAEDTPSRNKMQCGQENVNLKK